MPKTPRGEGPHPEGENFKAPKDRGSARRVEVSTLSNESVDFDNHDSVEKHLDQIIEQKVSASGREIKQKTKDRWKKHFYKLVDRGHRALQIHATEEGKTVNEVDLREMKIEKIGSFKQHIEQALKRVNADMPNKEELRDEFFLETAQKLKKGEKIVLIAYDLDNFKIINDRRGHGVGDKVLESFGGALGNSVEEREIDSLQDALRPDDTGAHFSGDEFGGLLVMPEDAPDEKIVKRIVERTQENTKRPSVAIGAKEDEMEKQEISTGYEIITYEEIEKFINSPEELKKIFDAKLKEADSRSLLSKAVRYVKEMKNQFVESGERVFGPNTKIEILEEELKFAQGLHAVMRSLSELYPEYAANSRNQLLEYASIMLLMPKIGKGDPKKFDDCISLLRKLTEELTKEKK